MAKDNYTPPSETAFDHAHTVARAGISSIPMVGGPALELFSAVIAPPLRRRQQEWMEAIAEALRELERMQKCLVETLKEDDAFIDAMLQASQAAIKTSQQEKREALKNAVLNSAIRTSLDESKRANFISLIDTLTVWHLRLLRWFVNPQQWYHDNNRQPRQITLVGNFPQILGEAFPELKGNDDLLAQYVSDLQSRGLLSKFGFHTNMGADGIYAERGSRLGHEFLEFITSPLNS